jgi:hypothetical protein
MGSRGRFLRPGPIPKGRQRALVLLLAVAIGAPAGALAVEVPRALSEAVADHPALSTLLTDYTFRRSVVSTGRVLDRDIHEFLLSRPDIGAALAHLQGLGDYHVRRVEPGAFEGSDGEGVSAFLRILNEAPGQRVFHVRGLSVLPLLPDISGEALVLLTTRYEEADGFDLAHGRLTVYARLDNRFLGGVLRLLLPLIGWVLDQKIAKAFLSESRAVELLARNPEAVIARLGEHEPLLLEDVAEFRSLLHRALARWPQVWAEADRPARAARDRALPPNREGTESQ